MGLETAEAGLEMAERPLETAEMGLETAERPLETAEGFLEAIWQVKKGGLFNKSQKRDRIEANKLWIYKNVLSK